MSACPAPPTATPPLGQLLLERDSLERELHTLTRLLADADAYLKRGETEEINVVLGCANRVIVRDKRQGVLHRLHAVRREIAGWIGG